MENDIIEYEAMTPNQKRTKRYGLEPPDEPLYVHFEGRLVVLDAEQIYQQLKEYFEKEQE